MPPETALISMSMKRGRARFNRRRPVKAVTRKNVGSEYQHNGRDARQHRDEAAETDDMPARQRLSPPDE